MVQKTIRRTRIGTEVTTEQAATTTPAQPKFSWRWIIFLFFIFLTVCFGMLAAVTKLTAVFSFLAALSLSAALLAAAYPRT